MKRFVNGQEVELGRAEGVEVTPLSDRLMVHTKEGTHSAVAVRVGETVHVSYRGHVYVVERAQSRAGSHSAAGSGEIRAPMPGQIVDVFVAEGQAVNSGDKILVLEAMKTQQTFSAPYDGVVSKLTAVKGAQVGDGEMLAVIEEAKS